MSGCVSSFATANTSDFNDCNTFAGLPQQMSRSQSSYAAANDTNVDTQLLGLLWMFWDDRSFCPNWTGGGREIFDHLKAPSMASMIGMGREMDRPQNSH